MPLACRRSPRSGRAADRIADRWTDPDGWILPLVVLTLVMCLGSLSQVRASPVWIEYRPQGTGWVRIQGDVLELRRKSFDWEVRGGPIEGFLRLAPDLVGVSKVAEGQVEIPVNRLIGFKEGSPAGTNMAAIVRQKLLGTAHPTVVFSLRVLDLEVKPVPPTPPIRCVAHGSLVIAGVTNDTTVPLRLEFVEGDRLTVSGECSVKMSDYSIEPPRGGTSTLQSADRVWISFEWPLVRAPGSPATLP